MRSSLIMAYLGVAVAVLAGGSAIAQLPPADGLDHPECIESCRRTTESDAGGTNHYILHCEDGCWEAMAADIGQVAGITVDAFGQVYFSNQTMVYELSHGAVRRIAELPLGSTGRAFDPSEVDDGFTLPSTVSC